MYANTGRTDKTGVMAITTCIYCDSLHGKRVGKIKSRTIMPGFFILYFSYPLLIFRYIDNGRIFKVLSKQNQKIKKKAKELFFAFFFHIFTQCFRNFQRDPYCRMTIFLR